MQRYKQRSLFFLILGEKLNSDDHTNLFQLNPLASLGMPPFQKSAVFLNIVQKAFAPPLLFEHLSYFAGGVWTSCGEFFWRNFNKSA